MSNLDVHYSSKSESWNTPQSIIDLVVKFFGEIDLDPCSDEAKRIPAKVHYTKEDNGLDKLWSGRTYINPPYGREIPEWIAHALADHLLNGSEMILLVPARPDTKWFNGLFHYGIICFIRGRLKFINPALPSYREDGNFKVSPAPFPSALIGIGVDENKFKDVFGVIGNIVKKI